MRSRSPRNSAGPAWPRSKRLIAARPQVPGRAEGRRQSFVIPYFSDHAYAYSGALRAAGHAARVLPLPSEEIRLLGEASTSGKECHPYSLLTGDLVHLARSPRKGNEVFFFFGTTIPCLLHQYGEGHRQLLKRMKVSDLSVLTPGIDELKALVGVEIGARLWRGLVAVDLLIKMVCETRPYELEHGQTDEVHRQNIKDIETAIATDELSAALTMAISRLRLIPVDRSAPRPVVGVAGDIYTRINPVGNQDLFLWLEERGCEVWPAPFLVDITDFSLRRDWTKGTLGEAALLGALMLRKNVESWRVRRMFRGQVKRGDEPGYQEVLDMATPVSRRAAERGPRAQRGEDGRLRPPRRRRDHQRRLLQLHAGHGLQRRHGPDPRGPRRDPDREPRLLGGRGQPAGDAGGVPAPGEDVHEAAIRGRACRRSQVAAARQGTPRTPLAGRLTC